MVVTHDYTSNPPGTMPLDGWVESCPRCGRSGVREAHDGGAEVIGEGVGTVAQLKGWVSPGEVSSEEAIPPDSGAVVGWGPGKAAVYRDPQGGLHRCSALCTHTGCVVGWNDVEKSWDCPCHGSRFDATGTVVNGPAPNGLAQR